MIFDLFINGNFYNIESIKVRQRYPILLICSLCKSERSRYVTAAGNLSLNCEECQNSMKIAVSDPGNGSGGLEDGVREFKVSCIKSMGCEVIKVPKLEVSVNTKDGNYFSDICIEDGSWEGRLNGRVNATIDMYKIKVVYSGELKDCSDLK